MEELIYGHELRKLLELTEWEKICTHLGCRDYNDKIARYSVCFCDGNRGIRDEPDNAAPGVNGRIFYIDWRKLGQSGVGRNVDGDEQADRAALERFRD